MNLKDLKTIKLTFVGDSGTEGAHFRLDVKENGFYKMNLFANRYPEQLVRHLNEWDTSRTYEVYNEAISGSAVIGNDDLNLPFEGQDKAFSWFNSSSKPNKIHNTDVLFVMLGANDAPYNWDKRKPLFKEYYKKIVDAYRKLNPNLKLYILSTYCIKKPSHHDIVLNDIIPMQKELAEELGGTFVDTWSFTKDYIDMIGYENYIDEGDQSTNLWVHPSEIGHAILAHCCFLNLRETLFEEY